MSNVATLITIRDGYLAALAADAADPQPSYSIEGQSVDRDRWRESLMKMIQDLDKRINAVKPYRIRTRMFH